MTSVTLVLPHQLFAEHPAIDRRRPVVIQEEWLFFSQYHFHKQKIAYHRATIQHFAARLRRRGLRVDVVEAHHPHSDLRKFDQYLQTHSIRELHFVDPVDDWASKRISKAAQKAQVALVEYESPMFINSRRELDDYYCNRSRFFQTDFYVDQRKRRRLLLDSANKPLGGKWTYDTENRLKYPKDKKAPKISFPTPDETSREACAYAQQNFANHYGEATCDFFYPCTHEQAERWLDQFLEERFLEFGPYEDAICSREHFLHHSVLTPMLNVGLLTPQQVIDRTCEFAQAHSIPLNSLEGFIRQIIGWREFIRAVYRFKGVEERTRNYWGFTREIPKSFWTATTGVLPIDTVIQKVLKTAYCHHIERLMVMGNFFLLCEFKPDHVYRWFMEMFIDAYDWVMVPNVYGMSQFADGGIMSTKPYISGSNYLAKMSDFAKGPWQEKWDALFWRFMSVHRDFFSQNPRIGMLLKTFDAFSHSKQQMLLATAEGFLESLSD